MIVGIRKEKDCSQGNQSDVPLGDLLASMPPKGKPGNPQDINYPNEVFRQCWIGDLKIPADDAGNGRHVEGMRLPPNCPFDILDTFDELQSPVEFQKPKAEASQNNASKGKPPKDLTMTKKEWDR